MYVLGPHIKNLLIKANCQNSVKKPLTWFYLPLLLLQIKNSVKKVKNKEILFSQIQSKYLPSS